MVGPPPSDGDRILLQSATRMAAGTVVGRTDGIREASLETMEEVETARVIRSVQMSTDTGFHLWYAHQVFR